MVEIASPEPGVSEKTSERRPEWDTAVGVKQVFFSPMAWLNLAWPGLGNITIGDMRGWLYGVAAWIFVFLSLFSYGIPLFIFWAFCCYRGYEYITSKSKRN